MEDLGKEFNYSRHFSSRQDMRELVAQGHTERLTKSELPMLFFTWKTVCLPQGRLDLVYPRAGKWLIVFQR